MAGVAAAGSEGGSLGDPETGALFEQAYRELRLIAGRFMHRQGAQHTLEPTALLHEVYLKLCDRTGVSWSDHEHFLATATRVMRHVLIDHYKGRQAGKRRAPGERVPLDDFVAILREHLGDDLEAVNVVLEELRELDPQMADFVDIKFFGFLGDQSMEVCAEVLGIPLGTLEKRWRALKAWLAARLR